MRILGLLATLSLALAFIPTGCAQREPKPQPEQYPVRGYRSWAGPGWYYGIYFSNESRYHSWRKSHYQRNRRYEQPRRSYQRGSGHRSSHRGRR